MHLKTGGALAKQADLIIAADARASCVEVVAAGPDVHLHAQREGGCDGDRAAVQPTAIIFAGSLVSGAGEEERGCRNGCCCSSSSADGENTADNSTACSCRTSMTGSGGALEWPGLRLLPHCFSH